MPTMPFSRISLGAFASLVLAAAVACTDPPAELPPAGDVDELQAMATSTRDTLLWKRGPALRAGLANALFLPEGDVCSELSRFDCFDVAHQVPLGGNDPFVQGQYEPQLVPGATSAVAFDRVVLSACSTAVEVDAARAAAALFRGHPLTDDPLSPDAVDVVEGAEFQIAALYERLHARKPLKAEVTALLPLLSDGEGGGVSGKDFAKLACFAIAGTSETLFY